MTTYTRPVTMLFVCMLIIVTQPSYAQRTSGNLEGILVDANGKALIGVNITVRGASLQGTRGAASDQRGMFRVTALPPGIYEAKFSHIGYEQVTVQSIHVQLGKSTTLGEISLLEALLEMPTVTITASSEAIDPTSTAGEANLALKNFDTLPMERDYQEVAKLVPGINQGYFADDVWDDNLNISGGIGRSNAYFVDGVNTTDPWFKDTGTKLPYNFVKEVQVKTGGYEAEYGRALSGIVNAVTHSGSNQFEMDAFGYYSRSDQPQLAAGEASIDNVSFADIGVGFRGPIKPDKLWYSVAYGYKVNTSDVEVVGLNPSKEQETAHSIAGKLDWKATDKTDVILNIFGDPGSGREVGRFLGSPNDIALNLDTILGSVRRGGINTSLRARHFIGSRILLEGAVWYSSYRRERNPYENGDPHVFDYRNETTLLSGGYGFLWNTKSNRKAAILHASVFAGAHAMKFGVEYEDVGSNDDIRNNEVFIVADDAYTTSLFEYQGEVHLRTPTVFVQDTWSISRRLNVNLGLRWDGEYWIDPAGNTALSIKDEWQPRFGFTLQLGELGTNKLFGSGGRFYEQRATFSLRSILNEGRYILVDYDSDPFQNPAGGDTTLNVQFGAGIIDPNTGGTFTDEFTLGFKTNFSGQYQASIRGIYRTTGEAVVQDWVNSFVGNPGRGNFTYMPDIKNNYTALELSLTKSGRSLSVMTSYVLSKNEGNWQNDDYLLRPENADNAFGLLPNDHTHVFKFSASSIFNFGLSIGAFLIWHSGAPISELVRVPGEPIILNPRGSYGRTDSVLDIDLRFIYDLQRIIRSRNNYRLILDVLNLPGNKTGVVVDEFRYNQLNSDGEPVAPNAFYGQPVKFQAPIAVRLGFEFGL